MGRRDPAGPDRGDRRHARRAAGTRRRGPRNRARGAELGQDQALSGLLLPARGEIWVNAEEARQWPPADASRSPTSSATGGFTETPSSRCSAAPPPWTRRHKNSRCFLTCEEQANGFAAALLMPAQLVEEEYARCRRDFHVLCQKFGALGAGDGQATTRSDLKVPAFRAGDEQVTSPRSHRLGIDDCRTGPPRRCMDSDPDRGRRGGALTLEDWPGWPNRLADQIAPEVTAPACRGSGLCHRDCGVLQLAWASRRTCSAQTVFRPISPSSGTWWSPSVRVSPASGTDAVPGIDKARARLCDHRRHSNGPSYRKTPKVFGFHTLFRQLHCPRHGGRR